MIIPKIYDDIINNSIHLLIAGTTGSGKSTALHGIITDLLLSENPPLFAFIDLKKVEMIEYKRMQNTIAYADNAIQAMRLLETIQAVMAKRYDKMLKRREKTSKDPMIYLIIDEYAELFIATNKKCVPVLQSILQLSRAANIRCILATQTPKADILNTNIKVNITSQLALRTRSAQDSRNIIGCPGSEKLPLFGYGIFVSPKLLNPVKVKLPPVNDNERMRIVKMYY